MHSVTSSNLNSIGWQDGTLYVNFSKGGNYKYNNVPESVFNEFKNSSSVGTYFHSHIRGHYTSERI